MSISKTLYENLCFRGKTRKHRYKIGSNLHKHHIIPKHSGGVNEDENITYLTIREHKIAHYLLWRIFQNPNDLRSYYMLGGKLTSKMRKIIGKWCVESKIGIFNPKHTPKDKAYWKKRGLDGIKTQIKNKIGIFNPKTRSKYASMGGKASIKVNQICKYWCSPEGRKRRASMGAKTHIGKKAMYKPGQSTFKRIPKKEWNKYLKMGYVFGSPIKSNLGKRFESKRKKKVTDGNIVYESVSHAAKYNNLTPGAVIHRIKNSKYYPQWKYVSDT